MLNLKRMFSVGEKVVALKTNYVLEDGLKHAMVPKEWGVYEIINKGTTDGGLDWLEFKGFKGRGYAAVNFRPLHDEISNAIIKEVGSYPKNIR